MDETSQKIAAYFEEWSPEDNRIESLMARVREQICYHDNLYYRLGEPEISDSEYDRLFRALQDLEEMYPDLITSDSPTQRVGY